MRLLTLPIFLLAAAALSTAAAQPVYKCSAHGKLSYSDRPCPEGQGETLPPLPSGIPAGATAGVTTGDARTLLDLEKVRTERDKQEAIEAREARARSRAGHVRIRQVERCQKLQLQHKWLEQDLAQATTPARQAALRTKLERQTESMAVECPH